jgi:hypothetical protein
LINAVLHGQVAKSIATLLADSINNRDGEGKTALMYAVGDRGLFGWKQGNRSMAATLVSLGADTHIRDSQGRTAWDLANSDAMKALLHKAMERKR